MLPHQDEDGLRDAPWPVRFAIRVGFPVAFASALLWFLLTNVTGALGALRSTQEQIIENQGLLITNQSKILELMTSHAIESDRSQMILQALCFNAANDATERDRCAMAFR